MKSSTVFGIGLLAGAVIASSTIVAARIPDSRTGIITGCITRSDGRLRVIDAQAGDRCSRNEAKLQWNQAGRQGSAGPQGPRGATGSEGVAGATGPAGPAGPQGMPGDPGVTGPEGASGPSGPAGPSGERGATGPDGPAGATGPQGPAGPRGEQGLPGVSIDRGGFLVKSATGETLGTFAGNTRSGGFHVVWTGEEFITYFGSYSVTAFTNRVAYVAANCLGSPYVWEWYPNPSNTLYSPAFEYAPVQGGVRQILSKGETQPITYNSFAAVDGDRVLCENETGEVDAAPVTLDSAVVSPAPTPHVLVPAHD